MVWVVSTIGTTNKFRQNPRGDPKFLVDLTRNDPLVTTEDHKNLQYLNMLEVKKNQCYN